MSSTGLIFGYSGKALVVDKNAAYDAVLRDTGFLYNKNRDTNILKMIADPEQQLTDYYAAVEAKADSVAGSYKADFDALTAAGFSKKKADKYAREKAKLALEQERRLLNLQFPLAEDIDTLSAAAIGINRDKATTQRVKSRAAVKTKAAGKGKGSTP